MPKKHQHKFKLSIPKDSFLNHVNNIQYTADVLIGNWYDNRIATKGQYTAIVPGLATDNKCLNAQSQYKDDYLPSSVDRSELSESFIKWRGIGYTNRCNAQSTIQLQDSEMFFNNFTSTKDVYQMNLQPIRPSIKKGRLGATTQDIDRTENYGNVTKTGTIAWKKCEEYLNSMMPEYQTEYKLAYLRHF